jgi:hypothetical protein
MQSPTKIYYEIINNKALIPFNHDNEKFVMFKQPFFLVLKICKDDFFIFKLDFEVYKYESYRIRSLVNKV